MTEASVSREIVLLDSVYGPMLAFEGDFATRQIRAFGAHTRNEIALLRRFVDAGDVIYDIGAHIGCFAIPLAQAAGETGRLIAVEAEDASFALLQRNLERHRLLGRATALLGLAGGGGRRYRPVRFPDHTSATYFVPDDAGRTLPTIDLDDLRVRHDEPVALIKIDVEGMELRVLQSAAGTIARERPILYIEVAVEHLARAGVSPDDVEAFLRRHAYRFFRNTGERNSTHDRFVLTELGSLRDGGAFFDVLAIPAGHVRLARALAPVP